jgi:hypothetical protein
MDVSRLSWHKSSYSGTNGGDCVEVAVLPDGGRAVRDSKDSEGAVLGFSRSEWAAFIGRVRAGEFG